MTETPDGKGDPESSRGVLIRRRSNWLLAAGCKIGRFARRAFILGRMTLIILAIFFFTVYRPWQLT
jgi:hypothetical protein